LIITPDEWVRVFLHYECRNANDLSSAPKRFKVMEAALTTDAQELIGYGEG
jgi:hypothetical protein